MKTADYPLASMWRTVLRAGIAVLGVLLGILAIALYFRWPVAEDFWPWTGVYSSLSPLSFYFVSSIAAAIAAPVLWIAITDKLHAMAPGGLNLLVAFAGIAVFIFQGYLADQGNARLLQAAVVMTGAVLFSGVAYLFGRTMRETDRRPLPAPVRYSFYVFVVALVIVGVQLILHRPDILPWQVTTEASVVYGWIFLGASVYFIYALLKPTWENGAGPLLGFLVYDIVLIAPFIRRFSDVPPQQLLSLTVYTIVLIYSALLAIYYLFIHPNTRLFGNTKAS